MNLVLIGMPGSGKSTVGKILSRMLCMPLVDTDAMVEAAAGETIPELFARKGRPPSGTGKPPPPVRRQSLTTLSLQRGAGSFSGRRTWRPSLPPG